MQQLERVRAAPRDRSSSARSIAPSIRLSTGGDARDLRGAVQADGGLDDRDHGQAVADRPQGLGRRLRQDDAVEVQGSDRGEVVLVAMATRRR